MKKTMIAFLTMALAACTVFAQQEGPAPKGPPGQPGRNGPPGYGQPARGDDQTRPGEILSPEMQNQMRADQRAIAQLGEAARAATDPDEKAKVVEQLRAKLNEIANRVQTHHEERIAQAEKHLADLRDSFQEEKANRAGQIEEQIQRILSGEMHRQPPDQPGRPGAPDGHGQPPLGGMPPPSQNPDARPPAEQPPPPGESLPDGSEVVPEI